MLVRILGVINLLLVGVLVVAALKPDTLRVERTIVINTPPAKIFALLDDFHQWPRWAPQDNADPSITRTYSGAASGVGAVSESRAPNGKVHGRMEITESLPDSRITMQTDYLKPFVTQNANQFILQPEGSTTRVTWAMQGTSRYLMKVMSVFVNVDRPVGRHLEAGLKSLKTAAEK